MRDQLNAAGRFLSTHSLSRSVLVLLTVALALLLVINLVTYVMIRRTEALNDTIEHTQTVRAAGVSVMQTVLDAETSQRGYLLTANPNYMTSYRDAVGRFPDQASHLIELVDDNPEQADRAQRIRELGVARLEILDSGMDRLRSGQLGQAIQLVRSGHGKEMMDRMRSELAALDAEEARIMGERVRRSNRSAVATIVANGGAGLLILFLAGVILWLIQRYVTEVMEARATNERANENLEALVAERTGELTRANVEIGAARDRAETLLREVNHRVGNSLQLVSSFILLQMRQLNDEEAKQALLDAQARIEAVAHVHRRLYTSDDVSSVAMEEYLAGLVGELRKSLGKGARSPELVLDAEPLRVKTDDAISVGVIVSELVTNAVKYAYPTGKPGQVRITLRAEGRKRGVLVVEDDGQGLGDGVVKGTGLGSKVVASMAKGLRSAIEYDADHAGVRARLVFEV